MARRKEAAQAELFKPAPPPPPRPAPEPRPWGGKITDKEATATALARWGPEALVDRMFHRCTVVLWRKFPGEAALRPVTLASGETWELAWTDADRREQEKREKVAKEAARAARLAQR